MLVYIRVQFICVVDIKWCPIIDEEININAIYQQSGCFIDLKTFLEYSNVICAQHIYMNMLRT